ncbi:hypothetical protein [Pseudarthrobacter sp. H2]|uniref:hypothetical protein n=1 Tax=Pseudarthrobacter sp. H2 TaxID=3418415 RepID=UPI003CEB5156
MISSGLEMPPLQNVFQTLSTWDFISNHRSSLVAGATLCAEERRTDLDNGDIEAIVASDRSVAPAISAAG